jgi:hypothetical protein
MNLQDQFKTTYAYQAQVQNDSIIKAWLARVEAAVAAMRGVEVEFATSLQERCEENQVYHGHDNQLVAEFLKPLLTSTEGDDSMDEESLPYYRIRFQDGVEIIADDAELFSLDPRFNELISAVSGAFAIAREMDFVGPWHLAADGTEADKARFLEEYQSYRFEMPPAHWAHNHNTPTRFRQATGSDVGGAELSDDTVKISKEDLAALLDMAKDHVSDIESGLKEGLYDADENQDIAGKRQVVDRIDEFCRVAVAPQQQPTPSP